MARWGWLVALLVGVDQVSKWLAESNLRWGERIQLLPVFDLTLVYNTGAAFSFLAGGSGWQRWLLIAVALAAVVFIVWLIRTHPGETRMQLALVLILAGAVGNLIDRVWHGHVIDFLLVYWRQWHYPAFNIADMAITAGAILLIWDEWQRWRRSRRECASRSQG